MANIPLEQAIYLRPDARQPQLIAKSPGFAPEWRAEAESLAIGFGERPGTMPCPLTVFAKPLTKDHIAVVRVIDENAQGRPIGLRFHFVVIARTAYEDWVRDPFMLADRVPPTWEGKDDLPALSVEEASFSPRTLGQVQAVLKRVKASALREGEDPEAPGFERTIENSERPALLGGAQILVDGGRVVFARRTGDLPLASGLWLLLPEGTRSRLWPTSFAFGADNDFDLLVVPYLGENGVEGYTTEDQAAEYPEGRYEFALQKAAEEGTQEDLDIVFSRRDSSSTIRLAIIILIIVSAIVIVAQFFDFGGPPPDKDKAPKDQVKKNDGK